jgi:hypothetical protein
MYPPRPEEDEADLVTMSVSRERAIAAALNGTIGCAASAALVLSLSQPGRPGALVADGSEPDARSTT